MDKNRSVETGAAGLLISLVAIVLFGYISTTIAQVIDSRPVDSAQSTSAATPSDSTSADTGATSAKQPIDWNSVHKKRDQYFAEHGGSEKGIYARVIFADDLDLNASLTSDSINEIQLYILVKNATPQRQALLSIATGIREGTLTDVRVEGATGYRWIDGELVIQYISLLPRASVIITVTGLPLISTDPVILTVAPEIRGKQSVISARSVPKDKRLEGKKSTLTDQFRVSHGHATSTATSVIRLETASTSSE